jgi:hypothetical protein
MPWHKSRFAPPQHAECENIVTFSLVCSHRPSRNTQSHFRSSTASRGLIVDRMQRNFEPTGKQSKHGGSAN